MPSYRFCRPDDLSLIVTAINQCYLMHYPDQPAMTQERLQEQMTLFDVRPGNCMVALERHEPVGVVVSTKREYGAWIQALGCKPAWQRRGIASQLVEALVRKITIQKVPVITVDVPAENAPARKFFEAVAFTVRGRYVSYQGSLPAVTAGSGEVVEVPAPELLAWYPQFHVSPACWERQAASLAGYGALPHGYAYREPGGVYGYVLHRGDTILDLAIDPQADAAHVSTALLGRLRAAGISRATLAKVPDVDPLCTVLERLGFTPSGSYLLMGQELR
jgi:GNAT superfamily N-acetyltransferase